MNRAAGIVVVLLSVVAGSVAPARAQGAGHEENPFANLGLPQIAVTITNDAFTGVPEELSTGRYVLSVTNEFADSTEETEGAAFLQLPGGMGAEEFVAEVAEATAPWRYETRLAGGPYAAFGHTAHAVIDLTPGEWILWGEVPDAPQPPEHVTITGDPPLAPPRPTADVTIEFTEFAFKFSAPFVVGSQIIEVANAGEQPHFVFIGGVPDGTTVAEAQAAFDAYWDPAGSPAANFSFAESPEFLGTGDQSTGTTAWYAVDLPAGTAVVACFLVDPESGLPHDALGMTEIVVVE